MIDSRPVPAPRRPRGFTLVELLVVIGIIALLISILLPTLGQARKSAKSIACRSNLRSSTQGMLLYANANDGYLPGSPNTTGWRWMNNPVTGAAYPDVVDIWDWATPITAAFGDETPDLTSDAERIAWYTELVNRDIFMCPENEGVEAQEFGGSTYGTRQWNSYSTGIEFMMKPEGAYGSQSFRAAPYGRLTQRNDRVALPGGYAPKLTKVGAATRKAFLVDGSRYLAGSTPTWNPSPTTSFGGNFGDQGTYSRFANGHNRDKVPGNTNGVTAGPFDSRVLWGRHSKSVEPNRRGGVFNANMAFFDGHVENLDDLEFADPVKWLPVNTRLAQGQTSEDAEARFINGNYVDGFFTIPE